MIHYSLRNNAQYSGGFTDLFILGTTRKYNAATKTWGSDFAAAAPDNNQSGTSTGEKTIYNLIQVTQAAPAVAAGSQAAVPIYIVQYPLVQAIVKYPFDNNAKNPKLDVGIAASLTTSTSLLAGTLGDLENKDLVLNPAASAIPIVGTAVSSWLTATITLATGNGNVDSLTPASVANGAEIWIYACLQPYRDWMTDRSV